MKKRLFVFVVIALIGAGILFTFAACDTGTDDDTGTNTGGDTGTDTGTDTDTDPDDSSFISVTDITNIPQIALTDDEMELNGVVLPSNATNQTITWSGDSVTDGKFKAATTGKHSVTATVENGKSESSPYTKTFTITAYDNTEPSNNVDAMQGSWTKENSLAFGGTDTFTLTGSFWSLSNSEIGGMMYATGIVLQDTGTKYKSQINMVIGDQGQGLRPSYFFDTGTYILEGNTFKMESSGLSTGYTSPMTGTWTKKE